MHNVFHVSLRVGDVRAATEQYRKILGLEPAKVKHDYAKFEITDPPVVLSLTKGDQPGTVAHLGIRYPETGELITERARSLRDGLDVIDQPNAECCYMKADKYWIRDDDGMMWEMYAKGEDTDGDSATDRDMAEALDAKAAKAAKPVTGCCA